MKNDSLPFSQVVRKRIWALWAVLALLLIFMVTVGEKGLIDSRYTTNLSQLSYKFLYFGGVIYTIYKIHYNRSLLKNKEKLRQEKILELDERTQWVHEKSGGLVLDILLLCLAAAACVLSFVDISAFNTAVSILFFAVLLKIAAYFYYKNK